MIKVTFKKPFYMMQYYAMCECMFVLCKSIEFKGDQFCKLKDNDILYLNVQSYSNIQSIEHFKPSEL